MTYVGTDLPRIDADDKLRGATRYLGDLKPHGLLHARLVLAMEAHATIDRVLKDDALAVPGVVAVLTAEDLPTAFEGPMRQFEPLARGEIVFAGQPVAIVLAETEAAAEDGVEAVIVETTALPVVLDLEAALEPGSPAAHVRQVGGVMEGGAAMHVEAGSDSGDEAAPAATGPVSPNAVGPHQQGQGDVAAALAGCDAVVRGTFRTSWVSQIYMEPQGALAIPEVNGGVTIHSSTQGAFYVRGMVSKLYGLDVNKIRVVAEPLGGAFGGKFNLIDPIVTGAALAVGRPVRLQLTRSEDFAAGMPASACVLELELGGSRADGLVALRSRILLDQGAFGDWAVDGGVAVMIGGPYGWQAWESTSYGVVTNRFNTGAYRGPGGPQVVFALEQLVDELAQELGVDPLELRRQSAAVEGDTVFDGTPWPAVAAREVIERTQLHPLWAKRGSLPANEGIGVAAGVWMGARFPSSATCRVDQDGGITVVTGAVDMSGTNTSFAAIAADTFGVPLSQVRVSYADTATAPHAPPSGGSGVTYSVGQSIRLAAQDAKDQLLEFASGQMDVAVTDLEVVEGMVRPVGSPDRGLSVEHFAAQVTGFVAVAPPMEGRGRFAPGNPSPSVACHIAHVRVDSDTGEVTVVDYAVIQDVGKALNPALVRGQLQGGAVQSIGWALYEELQHDENGQLLSGSFMQYAVPRADLVPQVQIDYIEVPSAVGPFGAKGIAEAAVMAGTGAVANAVAAAIGARLRELPMTAPRVWRALNAKV